MPPSGTLTLLTTPNNPSTVRYYRTDGSEVSCQLLDLEHKVNQPGSDSDRIRVCVRNDEFKWSVDYMLNTSKYFTPVLLQQSR